MKLILLSMSWIPSPSVFSEVILHLLGLLSHNFGLSSPGPSISLYPDLCVFHLKKPCVDSSSPPFSLPLALCFTSCFLPGQASQGLHLLALCFLVSHSPCSPPHLVSTLLLCWVALDRITSGIHVATNSESGEHFSLFIFLDLSAAFDIDHDHFVKIMLPFAPVTRLF